METKNVIYELRTGKGLSQEELASMENEIAPKVIQGVKLFVTQGIGKAMTIMNCKAPTENKAPAESKAPAEK